MVRLNFDPARKYQEILDRYQLLEKINQNISLVIYILDTSTLDLHFTTRETEKIIGYTQQEMQDMPLHKIKELFFAGDFYRFVHYLNQVKRGQDHEVSEIDFRAYRKDGKVIWLQNKTLIFERDALGRPVKLLGIAEDITQRIEFIKAIQERNRQLEEIAWLNAHEIRRPVASMLGLLSLLNKEDFTHPDNRQIIEYLERMVKELDVVIGNISIAASLHRKK
ncbi:MAG: PAS domain-containing protein [Bacteroidia bacterium]|nr:PAS domain-containing protein [Bacteroidia bacterium]MDW8346825.1 PAS domain-containing protein [Bacteroidia bacterium]